MERNAEKLLAKYQTGECTAEEIALIQQWYLQLPVDAAAPKHEHIEKAKVLAWENISANKRAPTKLISFRKLAVAASILLCVAVGLYFVNRPTPAATDAIATLKDVKPGSNKAILTLADGSVIDLDAAKNGKIVSQPGLTIRKSADGQLQYIVEELPENAHLIGDNLIATPRGGQYQVILPDGTTVWLNAASSLKYPTAFAKNERKVTLVGEAYFEVSKDKNRPFRVETAQQTIEVLGTHFNVNAYADEGIIKTTLLEGLVNVSNAGGSVKLHPGQQAQLKSTSSRFIVNSEVDLEKEVAWKNQLFSFDNDDLQTVMRQISRWYDVDIAYKGKIPQEKYVGEIPRNSRLTEVFKILELNHVHIDAKGKVLTVSGSAN